MSCENEFDYDRERIYQLEYFCRGLVNRLVELQVLKQQEADELLKDI